MSARRRQRRTVNRTNYDLAWLEAQEPDASYTRFSHLPVGEREDARRRVAPHISQAIVDHHFNRARVAHLLEDLGYAQTARRLRSLLPATDRSRKGNFGEVVASEHLVQRYEYHMPVFKLRYRDTHNMPMRGEDVVAFCLDDDGHIIRLCVAEAKVRTHFRSSAVLDAHERLAKTYRPLPETLSLIAAILYERGDRALGRELDELSTRLGTDPVDQDNWIVLITEGQPVDPFRSLEEIDRLVPDLHCVNLHLADLTEFVEHLFENPQFRAAEADDGGA